MTNEKFSGGCLICSFTTDNRDALRDHKICLEKEINSVFIEGRLWFDKINGNTYFSNRIWINGRVIYEMPMQYGYEEMYFHAAIAYLHERGYFAGEKVPTAWEIRDEMGIHLYKVATYGKKSELFANGK